MSADFSIFRCHWNRNREAVVEEFDITNPSDEDFGEEGDADFPYKYLKAASLEVAELAFRNGFYGTYGYGAGPGCVIDVDCVDMARVKNFLAE